MKNKFKHIFRVAVCLVLVCCLTVNISPIKAKAAVDPATAIAFDFAARSVVASIIQGNGVSKGSDPTVFDQIVDNAVDAFSTTTAFIANGFAKVARFNLDSGATMFFVPLFLVESLFSWMWENEILTAPSGVYFTAKGSSVSVGGYTFSSDSANFYSYCYTVPGLSGYWVGLASTTSYPMISCSDGTTIDGSVSDPVTCSVNGTYYRVFSKKAASCTYPYFVGDTSIMATLHSNILSGLIDPTGEVINVLDGLTAGSIASESTPFEDGYSDWAANSVSIPGSVYGSDDDYVPSVPIAVAPDYEGTTNMSQADVQAGNSTWVDTETDTDVGTDTEIGELSGTLAEADANTFLDKIGYFFECLLEGIRVLPDAIKKVLTDVFIPSQAFIQTKVETLLGEFPFIGDIISTGTYIRDSLTGASGPPVIYVDLSAADGDIDYGEKTLLTDFSWYAPYKGTVDSVLGAALWAFFGWRVFLRLPGLISGAEGYVGEFRTRYDSYSKKRKED